MFKKRQKKQNTSHQQKIDHEDTSSGQDQPERLLSILYGIEDLIYVADPTSYELLFVNQSFEEMFGKPKPGQKCYDILQDRSSPCPFCTNEKIFGAYQGQTYYWEFQNEVNKRWYRCADKAIEWAENDWVRLEIAADITQRVEAEKALAESEALYRTLTESSPEMIFVIDDEDRVRFVNHLAAEMFGTTPDKVMGKKRSELFPPQVADEQKVGLNHVFETGTKIHSESMVVFPDGKHWLSSWLVPIMEKDQVKSVMGISRDITQQKLAEEELAQSQSLLDLIINSIPALVSYVDANYRYQFVNQSYQDLFNMKAESILQQKARDVIGKEAFEAVKGDLDRALSGERIEYEREMPYKTGTRWTHTEFIPDKREDGSVHGLVALVNDITDRVTMEKELEGRIKDLERFNRQAVGRELKMVELKKEINQLLGKLDQSPRYDVSFIGERE